MKIKLLGLFVASLALAGCAGGYIDETPSVPSKEIPLGSSSRTHNRSEYDESKYETPDSSIDPDNPDNPGENNSSSEPAQDPVEEGIYKVSLYYGDVDIPYTDGIEDIQVIFFNLDTKAEFAVEFDEKGYAKTDALDGDYAIHLSGTPEGYTYDPNIYFTDYLKWETKIELLKLEPLLGDGSDLYSNIYRMKTIGVYRFEITRKKRNSLIYTQYEPLHSGYYEIETLCDTYADNVDPTVELYAGTEAYKNTSNPEVHNDGGAYRRGGYTKNVKWEIKLFDLMVGNVYAFGIRATVKDGTYPQYIDFRISYREEYEWHEPDPEHMTAQEANFKTDERDPNEEFHYANLGTMLFDGEKYFYNNDDRFWHYKSKNGPRVLADIDTPSQFLPEAFTHIEEAGNKNLTVYEDKDTCYYYKEFIERDYQACCNSEGRCWLTEELRVFLQRYSNAQLLFMDGNGFVEYESHVYAAEEDQWLFACGFYGDI
ncbi:MAG: hypothetical protein MJ238_02085 [Bacilli bacterium]|nr:hypothetical protein [Bacilli bacterium]